MLPGFKACVSSQPSGPWQTHLLQAFSPNSHLHLNSQSSKPYSMSAVEKFCSLFGCLLGWHGTFSRGSDSIGSGCTKKWRRLKILCSLEKKKSLVSVLMVLLVAPIEVCNSVPGYSLWSNHAVSEAVCQNVSKENRVLATLDWTFYLEALTWWRKCILDHFFNGNVTIMHHQYAVRPHWQRLRIISAHPTVMQNMKKICMAVSRVWVNFICSIIFIYTMWFSLITLLWSEGGELSADWRRAGGRNTAKIWFHK